MDHPRYAERQTLEAKRFNLATVEDCRKGKAVGLLDMIDASGQPFTHIAHTTVYAKPGAFLNPVLIVYAGYSDRHDATFTRIL